ncbi:hypothetical protein I6F11_17345 [Ensifer sp. NBAIM29]|nr:hypothetical protein [Ensifer sp. NBAIM29]
MANLTFEHDGKTFANFSEEAALVAGVPAAVVEAAKLADRRKAVSAECRRRIYAVGSAEAQMNVTTLAAAISAKTASSRSAEETAMLATVQESLDWVMAMRARFAELAADPAADFLDDASWPACPQTVIDLYAQF